MKYETYFDYINFFRDINNFECALKETEIFKEVKLTKEEVEAINLKDIKGYNNKKCSKEMGIEVKDFEIIINSARKKIALAISDSKSIKVVIEDNKKEIDENQKYDELCKFRCAICGYIYYIDYKKDNIRCPKCNSSKVMTSEEAGFTKKWFIKK